MDLSLALGKTLREVVEDTDSEEFLDWRVKLDRKARQVTPEQWLLATAVAELHNLAVSVRSLFNKNPGKFVTVQDCLPKWTSSGDDQVSKLDTDRAVPDDSPESEPKELDPDLVTRATLESQAVWAARLGLPPEFFPHGDR